MIEVNGVQHMQNSQGHLVPVDRVDQVDKLRDETVREIVSRAKELSGCLRDERTKMLDSVAALVAIAGDQYGAKIGGEKGNVTLISFDGRYKLVRSMQDKLTFGEQLMAAKALIDECVHEWALNADDNIKVLVNHAFQTDKEGKINTGRVLGLRRLEIRDAKWQSAMQAIADSIQIASTKPYVRFYKRNDTTGEYESISLDVAAV